MGTLTNCGLPTGRPLIGVGVPGIWEGVVISQAVEVGPILLQVAAKSARGEGVGLLSCKRTTT